ncbi:DUF5686 family protein [Flavobacterium soli]|uniref:DUF5686 family protein n=1 Tax=Flavobacterium soli TaxID=344881 RepID=UPI0003F58136|nr:DUF5686 family protein [Flavobacterium soli]
MKQLTVLFLFFSLFSQAQFQITGVVRDETTHKPLPFASISTKNGFEITDIDGKFDIQSKEPILSFIVSYIGFQKKEINTQGKKSFMVLLSPKSESLQEVAIGENPANAVIKKAIALKKQNDPQKKLNSFQFRAYNKLVITANPDSINGTLDSIFVTNKGVRKFVKLDSTDFKFKKIIDKQHIYQTEKISQYQFDGQHFKENVLATKMAGFKQPIYELIGLKLQSFSVYDSKYELLENRYDGALANDALREYTFKILDTVTIQERDLYVIFFKNKKRAKKNGLHGVLYIDQKNYAIAKAIFRVKNIIDISGIHDYEYLPESDLWFPKGKTFKIVKGNNSENIKILGGQIQFEGDLEDGKTDTKEKVTSDFVYLMSESNHFDFEFNVPLTIRKPAIAIDIKDDAIKKEEYFWQKYRKDSLDARGKQTYKTLDSIVIKQGIEKKLRIGRRVLNGYIPLSFFDIDLRYLVKYNNYEGFRLGFGGMTNEKLSDKFRLDGYGAYGLKDGEFKYSAGGAVRVGKFSNSWIGGSYTDDIREIASTSFAIDKRVFKIYDPRPINLSTFYRHKTWRAYIETKIIPKTESIWQITQSHVEPLFSYVYNQNSDDYTSYNMTTAMVSLQWNPFSDFMQTPTGKLEIEKRYPKFTFQFTKSLPGIMENDFDFGKVDIKAEYQKKYLNGQKTSFYTEFGYAFGDVPLTHLYNTSPNSLTKDNILQRITLAGKNSFETMYFNEFFSSQYALLQIKHAFKRMNLFGKVKPSVVLVSRAAWGNMEKPEQHFGIEYKTLNDGYFESGIELNQIYKGLGLSGFYRYGPNQLLRFEDNISIKLSFVLDLGL